MPGPIAVADLGTNSTRLLVARRSPRRRARELERRTDGHAPGRGRRRAAASWPTTRWSASSACLAEYRELADEHGADRRDRRGHERRARRRPTATEFRAAVRERHGFDVRTITRRRGGAPHLPRRHGRAATADGPTLVIDIGGGSTEYVVGTCRAPTRTFHVSTRHGLGPPDRAPPDAPTRPRAEELAALADEAARRDRGRDVPAASARGRRAGDRRGRHRRPRSPRSTRSSSPTTPRGCTATGWRWPTCERMLARLAALPLHERREVPGLHPDRAPTIVAGRGDPGRVDARLRARSGRGERGRHPPRRRAARRLSDG